MKAFLLLASIALVTFSCSKNKVSGSRVEIYTLTSFQYKLDTISHTTSVVNPVLAATPLVSNADIAWYSPTTHTFSTSRFVEGLSKVDPRGALAVCVDGQPVYFAKVHPGYLSSLAFGIPVMDPLQYADQRLPIGFVSFTGMGMDALDKRNDGRLLEALGGTGRLK